MLVQESRLRVAMSTSAPILLIVLGVMIGLTGGSVWVAVALGAIGIALGLFVLFDFTTSVLVEEAGISLIYPVRRRLIPWSSIDRLFNPRRRGLVAVTKAGEHHILVDRKLDPDELELLSKKARSHGVEFMS